MLVKKAINYIFFSITSFFLLFNLSIFSVHATSADPTSYANTNEVVTTHLVIDLTANFKQQQLEGSVEHQLLWKSKDEEKNKEKYQVVVDSRDLVIERVVYEDNKLQWQIGSFSVSKAHAVYGSALTIELPIPAKRVRIYYHTVPTASGLQWLTPAQTATKNYPFMYSQSQAIHARSWLPVQDTPSMRITYEAKISTPKTLLAVMSADNSVNKKKTGQYEFTMPQPIPAYLIALAIGDLHFQEMSKFTGVYAERPMLQKAVNEFIDTQKMMDIANELYGEYPWGRYDILVLPPAFPFGGMENPRLTFVTPTIIAGDKSLVNLIAHELAHSWSGNLVTNADWGDLWLNEGFTSYVENRLMEETFGRERALMELSLSNNELRRDYLDLTDRQTILSVDLDNEDPDDYFSDIPYTKGQLFLLLLEQRFGRDKFDLFLRNYFDDFAFKSVTTEDFIAYVKQHLINKYPGIVSEKLIQEWLYQPGLHSTTPNPQSTVFKQILKHKEAWLIGHQSLAQLPTKEWTVHEWIYFINQLPRDLSHHKMQALDSAFNLTKSSNAEIVFAWFNLAIGNDYDVVYKPLTEYLTTIGRMRLIVPLYKKLYNIEKKQVWITALYRKNRARYHPLAQSALDNIFN